MLAERMVRHGATSAAASGTIGLAEAPPHYHGHRERLRDRFRDGGSDALSDYELLELVLFRACRDAT